jgi:DNA sulfur modification protein DndB
LTARFGQPLVAIDGETQLAARYEAANIRPETLSDRVPVIICHGRSLGWARQVFHDVNTFGVKPNAALAVAMDERDLVTSLARDLANDVPFLHGRVNFSRRQLRRTDPEVITISTLRLAALAFVGGTPALQKGAQPELTPERLATIRNVAIAWFTRLTTALGDVLEDREKLAATAPSWVAFGAIGHNLLDMDEEARRTQTEGYLSALSRVHWDRSANWSGIIGKMGANESFAVGSTKEVIHQTVRALTDESDPGFARVRAA